MKKALTTAIAVLVNIIVFSQQEIKLEELKNHIGDSVKVCTKIYGGIYLDRTKGTPTFLNACGSYPDNPLTLVIWADVRAAFGNKPEEFYKDKQVCITGKVELYKEKPQIVIHSQNQLAVQ
ncbi:MAG: hypothetical protein WDO16_19260 [Bacteroidota bacterium]